LDFDQRPVGAAVEDVVRDPDDGAVHRRVDIRAGHGAHVEPGGLAAVQLVVDEASAAAAEDLVREP